MTGDAQKSLDKLKPIEFYPWASYVPTRFPQFKRHKTIGHAHAARMSPKATKRVSGWGSTIVSYFTPEEPILWMWLPNPESADPGVGEWMPYEVWRDGEYVQIATKTGQTECACKSGLPVFVADDPFLDDVYSEKIEGVWCRTCYDAQAEEI